MFLILGMAGLAGIFLLFCVAMVVLAFIKHNKYMKYAKERIKVVLLPTARAAYNIIVERGMSDTVLSVPMEKTNTLPRYFYNKSNTWATRYPESPFLGLTFLQVQIDTVYYRENNPEPLTSDIASPLMTANSIYAAMEEEFELLIKTVSTTIATLEKKLMEALSAKLNKYVVYFALIIIIGIQIVGLIMTIQGNSHISALNNAFGIK
jgi:hypothetical protein